MKAVQIAALVLAIMPIFGILGPTASAADSDQSDAIWIADEKVSTEQSELLKPYLRQIFPKIERNWYPPEYGNYYPRIRFTISANGRLDSLELRSPSKNAPVTKACLRAIAHASPFPALPEKIAKLGGLCLETQFNFTSWHEDAKPLQGDTP